MSSWDEAHRRDLRVLHLAPDSVIARLLRQNDGSRYVGADLHPRRGQVKADITSLPFSSESFDLVVCSHVLEHITDDRRAIGELFRVVTKGGHVILQQPVDSSRLVTYEDSRIVTPRARLEAFGQEDHVRVYGQDFLGRLREQGFQVSVKRTDQLAARHDALRYKLEIEADGAHGEDIYVCTRQG